MLEVKVLLYGVQFCGMMHTDSTCGEVWSRMVSGDTVRTLNRSELQM
jgi:hypothetical protein